MNVFMNEQDITKYHRTPILKKWTQPGRPAVVRKLEACIRSFCILLDNKEKEEMEEGGTKPDANNELRVVGITTVLLLTPKQQLKLNSPRKNGRGGWIKILFSPGQLSKNREYEGDGNYISSLLTKKTLNFSCFQSF